MPDATHKTDEVELAPHAPEHLRAIIVGVPEYESSIALRAAAGLRDFLVSPEISPAWLEQLQAATGVDPWRFGFAVVHSSERVVIGLASFKGPPTDDGSVEIAYGIVPTYQNSGFATQAARLLMRYAIDQGNVRQIVAHTLPQPNASTRVLQKCGFRYVGEVQDPEDGPVWRWEWLPATNA